MARHYNVKTSEMLGLLSTLGFKQSRMAKGSHHHFEHEDGRKTAVAYHSGSKVISDKILNDIAKDIGLDAETVVLFIQNRRALKKSYERYRTVIARQRRELEKQKAQSITYWHASGGLAQVG